MATVIQCTCGEEIDGETDEERLARAREHIAERHPDMVGVPDEQLLALTETRA